MTTAPCFRTVSSSTVRLYGLVNLGTPADPVVNTEDLAFLSSCKFAPMISLRLSRRSIVVKERNAVVIGAGIGGLATAVGLTRAGWQVTVYERAQELRPAGGGIGLTPNGLRALNVLGAGDRVRAAAIEQRHGGIRSPNGAWISRTDLGFIRDRYGEPVVALHRAALIGALRELLPPAVLATGTPVSHVDPGDARRRAEVHTTRG